MRQLFGPRCATLVDGGLALVRRAGGTRVGVFVIGQLVSPLHRWLYRLTGGRISLTGRAPVLLLTTTGRRTGKQRTVPVFYVRDGERLVVCNVTPPSERANPWTLNLRATPYASVQIRDRTIRCRAHPATDHELTRYWPELTEIWPPYQRFVDEGGEQSVFVLDPVQHP